MHFLIIVKIVSLRLLEVILILAFSALVLTSSIISPSDSQEQVRFFTRDIEFDYVSWILDALGNKALLSAYTPQKFTSQNADSDLVRDYFKQVEQVLMLNSQIEVIYADPKVANPLEASQELRQELEAAQLHLDHLSPLAEAVLQDQLSVVLHEFGFGAGGQIVPPPLYQVTDLPLALIVSPRNKILRQEDISLQAGMTTQEKEMLEVDIFSMLNLSALVVPVGGIGAYPTMVMHTTDLVWLAETIAHEWTHNYLTLRPLGINYNTSAELRTINETTASLVGKELGLALIKMFYPELTPPPPVDTQSENEGEVIKDLLIFDFRAEMKVTRDNVDEMLAKGKIELAEKYMEARRKIFWDNGYLIRKLNQAYFAFYGAYNDVPGGGASGSDPIGPVVIALRNKSPNLRMFLKEISVVNSYEELLRISEKLD